MSTQRKDEMQRLVDSGLSLEAVGDKYGISRERVRQIIGNVGGQQSLAARTTRMQKQTEAQARVDEVRAEIVRLYADLTVREIGVRLEIPDGRIYRVLKEQLGETYRHHHKRRYSRRQYTRADARAALQRCAAEIGRSPSTTDYDKWSRGKKAPSLPTLTVTLYGSWSEAKVDAGLLLSRAPLTGRRTDYVTPEECLRGVRFVWDSLGHPPTLAEYEHHAKKLGLTASTTVRKRLGGWHSVIRAADKLRPREETEEAAAIDGSPRV